MRTINTSTLTIKIFDADPYLNERNLMIFRSTKVGTITLYINSVAVMSVAYPKANLDVTLDLSDIVRTYPNPVTVYLTDTDTSSTATITWSASGKLVNPDTTIRPAYNKESLLVNFDPTNGGLIFAPSSTYPGDTFIAYSGGGTITFNYQSIGQDIIDNIIYDYPTEQTDKVIDIYTGNGNEVAVIELRSFDCRRYCALRWESMFKKDLYKNHTFVIAEISGEADDTTECYNVIDDGTSRLLKNRVEKCVVLLENLTTYDVWYYSDLITSNNVFFDFIENGQRVGKERRVQVLSKSLSTSMNDAKRVDLQFELLIKKIDAL